MLVRHRTSGQTTKPSEESPSSITKSLEQATELLRQSDQDSLVRGLALAKETYHRAKFLSGEEGIRIREESQRVYIEALERTLAVLLKEEPRGDANRKDKPPEEDIAARFATFAGTFLKQINRGFAAYGNEARVDVRKTDSLTTPIIGTLTTGVDRNSNDHVVWIFRFSFSQGEWRLLRAEVANEDANGRLTHLRQTQDVDYTEAIQAANEAK